MMRPRFKMFGLSVMVVSVFACSSASAQIMRNDLQSIAEPYALILPNMLDDVKEAIRVERRFSTDLFQNPASLPAFSVPKSVRDSVFDAVRSDSHVLQSSVHLWMNQGADQVSTTVCRMRSDFEQKWLLPFQVEDFSEYQILFAELGYDMDSKSFCAPVVILRQGLAIDASRNIYCEIILLNDTEDRMVYKAYRALLRPRLFAAKHSVYR